MGLIIVNTQAGLANRLRAIESGLSLANKLGFKCKVIWNVDGSMAAEFTQLFKIPEEFDLDSRRRFKFIRNPSRLFGLNRNCSKIINFLCGVDKVFDSIFVHEELDTKNVELEKLCKNKTSFFSTYEAFFEFIFNYSWLKPIVEIEEKIIQFTTV